MAYDDRDVPPQVRDRWSRRYWGYVNRPYPGFGCLWMILVFFLFYILLSLLFAPLRFGYW
ncbi:MAG: hypothetical protein IT174_09795 [Acidobacteria bacterium]|nr:hypothetical protein [Acidobacteriota bacterium]